MTKISCSAHTCVHNTDSCCCLSNVQVGGREAKKSCDTCCDSFYERKGEMTNVKESICSNSDIRCAAEKCIYNDNEFCTATQIDVAGMGACDCNQTECETFRKS